MPEWIASSDALADILHDAASAERVGIDTEFVRERTYYAQLALVQIAIGDRIALVDPLAIDDPAPLLALLRGPAVKIMHSPGEDVQAFAHRYQAVPTPIFDTQVAAALTGFGAGIGYQRLVESVLGVTLPKGETRSDWLRRPLSASQQEYAADDVLHLEALYQELSTRLQRLGREDWMAQDCARLLEGALDDSPDPNPHLSMRPAQRMSREAQARLRRLLRWRDAEARTSDKPRRWVLENDTALRLPHQPPPRRGVLENDPALRLADQPPASRESFDRYLDTQPRSPRRKRDEVWDLLQQPLDADEQDMPLVGPREEVDKNALRALQNEVAAVAAEHELPEGLLCARRHLESILDNGQWPRSLEGWRSDLLRDRLLAKVPR